MFCLNCICVINAAAKQIVSRSFPKCGVSAFTIAATLAAQKNFFLIKSNLIYTRFIKFAEVPKRGSEQPRGVSPGQCRSEKTSQRWRAVGYTISDLTSLGIEPQTFRFDSKIFNTARFVEKLLKYKKLN